ncbi:MAG: hypothetical protein ACI9GZ_001812 [Bacteroidia bacterium]|jgi:hypothetical protein
MNTPLKFHLLVFFLLVLVATACSDNQKQLTMLELMDPDEIGINFSNDIKEDLSNNGNIFSYTNFYNGGGVAVGDINNDNMVDIYLSSNQKTGKLFLNKGNFKFDDVTAESGLDTLAGWKTGVVMSDVNQDGYLDIYICRSGRIEPELRTNLLYVNNGDLTFTERGSEFGLDDSSTSLHATFFDYDLDGDLDMYLLNHAIDPVRELSKWISEYEDSEEIGDKVFENVNGHFTEIRKPIGINKSELGDGLGIAIGDLNNDHRPDVYVCNDFLGRDYLYQNTDKGVFEEKALTAMQHISYSSMGVDMADIDNDGWQDLFVLDMRSSTNYGRKTNMASMNPKAFDIMVKVGGHHQYMRNTLQLNNGNQTFSDIAPIAGLSSTDWSWAPLFVDIDNDGYKDLFVTNGIRKNTNNKDYDNYRKKRINLEHSKRNPKIGALVTEILSKIPSEKVTNLVYRNTNGLHFERKNEDWGISQPSFSNGAAYADFDNDGDMDLVVNNIDDLAHVYRNNANELTSNHFLKVILRGDVQNLNGIGAKLMVKTEADQQYFEQQVSRGYQSSVDYTLHVGLGQAIKADVVKVTWTDGKVTQIMDVSADQKVIIKYKDAMTPEPLKQNKTLFKDITTLHHKHTENYYDDFEKEVLLPHKMSTFGPALAVGDINGDNLDDFFIGGSKGFEGTIYSQKGDASFVKRKQSSISSDTLHEDIDAIFFDADQDGDQDLYVVSGGNEMPAGNFYYQDRLYTNDGKGNFTRSINALPVLTSSGGVVNAHDFDKDGDLDLFVGARLLPGQYPRAGRSYLLENKNGRFEDVTAQHDKELESPGMVTDALWSDYDGDSDKDLILVGEWMPVTIFQNNHGKLEKIKNDSALIASKGWWFSITEADVDHNGMPDYLLGNLGENYKYTAKPHRPFKLYSNDFDGNGSLDIVLSYYEGDKLYPLRGKQCSSEQIPDLKKKFTNYHSFGLATLHDVYDSTAIHEAEEFEVNTFSNSLMLNLKSGFSLVKLPKEAQISAVFGMVYEDFDKDGFEDIVLAGNLYNSEIETPRNDAGIGLFLKGDGNGNFNPVKNYVSGLNISGDVKKLKSIRFGNMDNEKTGLIAGVNNDYVKLITTH